MPTSVKHYRNAQRLSQLPIQYATFLPEGDAIQYVPVLKTPNWLLDCKAIEFVVPPIDNGPSVIKNVSGKPLYITMLFNSPVMYSIERPENRDIPCIHYARYRKMFIRSNVWKAFNLAFFDGEFHQKQPVFTVRLEVSIRADTLQDAMRIASEQTRHWQFDNSRIIDDNAAYNG